jgi:hypothetical protein
LSVMPLLRLVLVVLQPEAAEFRWAPVDHGSPALGRESGGAKPVPASRAEVIRPSFSWS